MKKSFIIIDPLKNVLEVECNDYEIAELIRKNFSNIKRHKTRKALNDTITEYLRNGMKFNKEGVDEL